MDTIKVQLKDVANFLNNLDGFDYRVIAEFYNEEGFFVGEIDKDYYNGWMTISSELRGTDINKVKFSSMYTQQDMLIIRFVLKGE